MELTLQTPLLLFPAVSLLFLSYNARFLTLAQLIRSLHKEYREVGDPTTLEQIASLRRRLRLIVAMQAAGALAFVAAAVSTTCVFFKVGPASHVAFGAALVFLIASVLILLVEIGVSTRALSLLLSQSERESQRPAA